MSTEKMRLGTIIFMFSENYVRIRDII